jgi:BON domain
MIVRRALALALVWLLAGGCALAGRSLGAYVDDKLVKGAVKRRLVSEHLGIAPEVKVDTYGGIVYLTGPVDSAEQKSNAEIAAWQVEGVKQVVNDLVVARPPAEVSALPSFPRRHQLSRRLPGIVRVDPGHPGGPDLAYDANGRVVASIYTVSWQELVDSRLTTLPPAGRPIDHVSMYPLSERPTRPGVHYAVVLWHVSEREAAALR